MLFRSQKHRSFARGSFIIPKGVHSGGNPVDLVLDYVRMTFHLDIIKYNLMLLRVKTESRDIMRMHDIIGRIDTAICLADYRASLKLWCRPDIYGEGPLRLDMESAYHPLIEDPVMNSASLEGGILITGSNASGKSTFLKMTAVNLIMAQSLSLCCAKSYKGPYMRLYTSVALRDDIFKGESYYTAEIRSLKRILDATAKGNPMLCVIDEVLRGTNTVERIAASYEIIKALKTADVIEVVATHDIELTSMLSDFKDHHFREEISGNDVSFDYKLYDGPATSRNAIKLLKVIGFDDDIVKRAEEKAAGFLESGVWKA